MSGAHTTYTLRHRARTSLPLYPITIVVPLPGKCLRKKADASEFVIDAVLRSRTACGMVTQAGGRGGGLRDRARFPAEADDELEDVCDETSPAFDVD